MKTKIFLIMVFMLLLSGCSANYDIKINKNLSVDEYGTGIYPNSFYNAYTNSTFDRTLERIIEPDSLRLRIGGYTYNKYVIDSGAGIKFSKHYSSIKSYSTGSFAYTQYFDKLNYKEENGIITLSSSGKFYGYSETDPDRYPIGDMKISISLPFKVIESNADSCSGTSTTTCVWNINKATSNKPVMISFNKNKKISSEDQIFFFAIGALGVIILISIMKFVSIVSSKNKF